MNKKLNKIIYFLIQKFRREPVHACLKTLLETQWYSRDQLRELQSKKFKKMVDEAYGRVPFYRHLYDAHGIDISKIRSLDDISKLPLVSKDDIRNNLNDLTNPDFRGPRYNFTTSGSSGQPLTVLKSGFAAAAGRAAFYRGHAWHGIDIGEREFRIWAYYLDPAAYYREKTKDFLMNRKGVVSFDLSEQKLMEFCSMIRAYRPAYIYAFPSSLFRLASFIEDRSIKIGVDLKAVITTAEVLYPYRREKIQSAFNCKVINEYGCSEASILAYECPAGSLHQTMENVYLEILPDRYFSHDSNVGEVVITDLNNLLMPLIRYRLGDIAMLHGHDCSCGRKLQVIDVKEGSTFGMLEMPDGRVIGGVNFYYISEHLITKKGSGLKEFKIYKKDSRFTVKVVKKENYEKIHGDELLSELRSVLGADADIRIEFVERIESHGREKFKILITE